MRRFIGAAMLWALAAILIFNVVATEVSAGPGVVEPVMVAFAVFCIVAGWRVARRSAPHADESSGVDADELGIQDLRG